MLPPHIAEVVTAYRALVDAAHDAANAGDVDALVLLARQARSHRCRLTREGYHPFSSPLASLDTLAERACHRHFPVPTGAGDPFDELVAWLALPWPSLDQLPRFRQAVERALDGRGQQLADLAEAVLAMPASSRRTALLRGLMVTPFRQWDELWPDTAARLVAALHAAGGLERWVVEAAFDYDRFHDLAGFLLGHPDRLTGDRRPELADPACAAMVREVADDLTWRLTTQPTARTWDTVPRVHPRGLRFVLRGLDIAAGRLPVEPLAAESPTDVGPLLRHLLRAELTDAERAELLDVLSGRSEDERRIALVVRLPDADAPLEPLGLASTTPVLALLRSRPGRALGEQPGPWDLAEIRAAVEAAGRDASRDLLAVLTTTWVGGEPGCPAELYDHAEVMAAAFGGNRAALKKRVRHNALNAIAAYGLLPLDDGETVLDRYLALREIARKGAKLGPNRRLSQAAAVDVALNHLAQLAGYPDPGRLEWDLEARLAAGSAELRWSVGDYTLDLHQDGPDVALLVSRAGRPLKSVPAALRKDPAYAEARAQQQRLREQARRIRDGLVERLVATAGVLTPDELARLRTIPAAAAMLAGLVWRDGAGNLGLLDGPALVGADDTVGPAGVHDTAVPAGADSAAVPAGADGAAAPVGGDHAVRLVGVDGTATPVDGPLTAAHPWHLHHAGQLGAWQREVVRRRLRQPVKQVFRELYVLTPPERASRTRSWRFAGHRVRGAVAVRLLSGRGWSVTGDDEAVRRVGSLRAVIGFDDVRGYLGADVVTTGAVSFLRDGAAVDLPDVPGVVLSETMRDLDLVVSVAAVDGYDATTPAIDSRRDLLAALLADLGLPRVTVEGHFARVTGTRADYRVHLGSGAIHLEPGGHLCVIPAGFGDRPHARLFLPFADEDAMTSVVLSKVLMLAEDEKITDPTILAQIPVPPSRA